MEREAEDIAKWQAKAAAEEDSFTAAQQAAGSPPMAQTDPTIAHAGLTELDSTIPTSQLAPSGEPAETFAAPASASVGDIAANAAGADRWDSKAPGSDDLMGESYEIIPRPSSQVESPHMPAPQNSTLSWADEASDMAAVQQSSTGGFQEVHHRGSRGRGGYQGGSYQGGGYQGGHNGPGNGQAFQWQGPQGGRGRGGAPGGYQQRGNGNNYGHVSRGRGEGRGPRGVPQGRGRGRGGISLR